ncbi:serine/threonine-protein kinase [Kamptonema formosum]|uniref:serine/threonine-protein kinase n=1 Tax=Kamptonema formosum TaxID=331992 RepID=UPI0003449622|nr:serine/threonine-protein kinase [Oscillatoria sp. PCC 10802]
MIYCINPDCKQRENPENLECCQTCGTSLLIHERYRLLKPLRPLDPRTYTDIFEVDDGGTRKVMKVLKDSRSQLVEGFEREALTLELLDHPGIPKVDLDGYFTFTPSNSTRELHCLVMEKIEGQNLEQWLAKEGPIPSQSLALNWLRQLIEILEQVHKSGFFHRDIKPSNIILKPDGQLVLIDFGSVREMTHTYLAKLKGGLNLTAIISGGYTPQEQVDGRALPQSDFYALGRTFVHLLTGKHPSEFLSNSAGQLIWQYRAPQISKPLADFIDDMMAILPEERPKTTAEILRDLTPKRLQVKSVQRFLSSRKFKFLAVGFLSMGIASAVSYWLSLPLQAEAIAAQGRKNIMDGNLNRARKELEQALSINPKDAVSRSDLGLVCKMQQEFECALAQYQQALKLASDEVIRATIHYNLGFLHEDRREFDAALKEYQIAMQEQGEIGVNATNNFARLQILHEFNYSLAIDSLLKVLDRTESPRLRVTLYKNLGWALLQQGDCRSAEKYLREAIRLDKENRAAPHCLLAKVLQDSDKMLAPASWKKCRDSDSENLPEVEIWQLDARRYLNAQVKKR